jgi:hypothetical protein
MKLKAAFFRNDDTRNNIGQQSAPGRYLSLISRSGKPAELAPAAAEAAVVQFTFH